MSQSSPTPPTAYLCGLSDEEKAQLCTVLRLGGDRQTAAGLLGKTLSELRTLLRDDVQLQRDLRQAESQAELRYLEKLLAASSDPKNWRVAVWWFERHAPDRFARRDPRKVTVRQLEAFVESLSMVIIREVHSEPDRRRLLEAMRKLVDSLTGAESKDL